MRDKKVKYIEIAFENVETVTIDINNVEELRYEMDTSCETEGLTQCKRLFLSLKKGADEPLPLHDYYNVTVFERLMMFSDVTSIELLDENRLPILTLCVPWEDKTIDGNNNVLQLTTLTPEGNLLLVIQ